MTTSSPLQSPMVDPSDNIFYQARQGSVAAVIQILNERLAEIGVRTRAVLDEGVLQVLCEASTADQLDQDTLVPRIQGILEGISPRGIRKVNLNGRIVREQQLLWLEEIRRDPHGQLLWSELITLKRLHPWQRFREDQRFNQHQAQRQPTTTAPKLSTRPFVRGVVGGASAVVLLGLVSWAVSDWLQSRAHLETATTPPITSSDPASPPANSPPPPPASQPDPFAQAVNLATQASLDGTVAKTRTDWLDLATRWQRAADLMSEVPATDNRYNLAQTKVQEYQANGAMALERAEQQMLTIPAN